MNERNGLMIKLALNYRNNTISKRFVKDYCEKNNWSCDFGTEGDVLIYPKKLELSKARDQCIDNGKKKKFDIERLRLLGCMFIFGILTGRSLNHRCDIDNSPYGYGELMIYFVMIIIAIWLMLSLKNWGEKK